MYGCISSLSFKAVHTQDGYWTTFFFNIRYVEIHGHSTEIPDNIVIKFIGINYNWDFENN